MWKISNALSKFKAARPPIKAKPPRVYAPEQKRTLIPKGRQSSKTFFLFKIINVTTPISEMMRAEIFRSKSALQSTK